MTIAFFITDTGEFYANMEKTSLNEEVYNWLSENHIDLGRESSFNVSQESPVFSTVAEAEIWLSENWFPDAKWGTDYSEIDDETGPTEEDYQECARVAHEINEIAACAKLEEILQLEYNHSYLCQIGIWYWSLEHRQLAIMAYKRSIELQPEAATYFNMAVCLDDLGELDAAGKVIAGFYELVPTGEEKEQAEATLHQNGKVHLIRS
jgi:tetratricopeptide (TPR) repeat protein